MWMLLGTGRLTQLTCARPLNFYTGWHTQWWFHWYWLIKQCTMQVWSITQPDNITGNSTAWCLHWFPRILQISFRATDTLGSVSQELAVLGWDAVAEVSSTCFTRDERSNQSETPTYSSWRKFAASFFFESRRDLGCKLPQRNKFVILISLSASSSQPLSSWQRGTRSWRSLCPLAGGAAGAALRCWFNLITQKSKSKRVVQRHGGWKLGRLTALPVVH